MLRFEIASLMRQIYPKLPEGVSYPSLSSAPSGEQLSPVLIYTLNAGVPSQQIQQYAEENIVKELARIKGWQHRFFRSYAFLCRSLFRPG